MVEFWADFARNDEFKDWKKLTGVKYYRANISKVPQAVVKYNIYTLLHIIFFKDGYVEQEYKAGILLRLSETGEEMQKKIDELLEISKF